MLLFERSSIRSDGKFSTIFLLKVAFLIVTFFAFTGIRSSIVLSSEDHATASPKHLQVLGHVISSRASSSPDSGQSVTLSPIMCG